MESANIAFERLSVNLAGVRVRTHIAVGAIGQPAVRRERLTPERYAEIFLKHIEAGAGFIMLPSSIHVPAALVADLEKKAKPARFATGPKRPNVCMRVDEKGLSLYFVGGHPTPPGNTMGRFEQEHLKLIEVLRKKKPKDVPLVANVSGLGYFPETFVSTARAHEQAGVDLIELNMSSPGALYLSESIDGYFEKNFPLSNPGLFLGDQPDLAEKITREVIRAVSIPVGVKVTPETGFPRIIDLARRIRDAGARFITCANFGVSIAPPDIYNQGKAKWRHIDVNPFAALGGGYLRMSVYKQVAAVARYVPGIDIMACGGLEAPEHIIEAMMLGAKAVQTVTPVLYRGRKLLTRDIQFISQYMDEQGYQSVKDFTGLGLPYIKSANESPFRSDLVAEVNAAKCTGCGFCADSICLAMRMEDGVARVNIEDCSGCGICVAICPKNAVSLSPSRI